MRGQTVNWPFGVFVCLAYCGSHAGKRMFGHICLRYILPSEGCCSMFWFGFILFFLFTFLCIFYFFLTLLFSSFLFQPEFLMAFFARMIFWLVSIPTQQLLPLSLHTASYLFLLSTNFINIYRFLTSLCSGLYDYFSAWYILHYPFCILCLFVHFVFLLQNCQIIWGWVCVMIFRSHMTYSHLPSIFSHYSQLKLSYDTVFGFLDLGSKYPYKFTIYR